MKTLAITLSAALAVGACAPAMAQDAASTPQTSVTAEATARTTGEMPVIRDTDGSLTCVQIADEAAQLSQTMGGDPGASLFSTLGGVARAGAAMVIPGAGLVLAGADALTRPERERKEAEVRTVQNRWYYLNGLYAGQNCNPQAEAAAADAARN